VARWFLLGGGTPCGIDGGWVVAEVTAGGAGLGAAAAGARLRRRWRR
jgi:hypothetical protein